MSSVEKNELMELLKTIAPGTKLRAGLDSILSAKSGALIVVGENEEVMELAEGGFEINCDFSPSLLYELAKLDGAIILSEDAEKILRANVHLHPRIAKSSTETGIRHRVAQRMARQTGVLVIAISHRRATITLYKGHLRHVLQDTGFILTKANQAVQTLEKYKDILNQTLNNLSILELDGLVTVYDVIKVIQRALLVLRIIEELELYICQLGSEGKLVNMQLKELDSGLREEIILVLKDYYCPNESNACEEELLENMVAYSAGHLLDTTDISRMMGYGSNAASLDREVTPRGYRLVAKTVRMPCHVVESVVDEFGSLPEIMKREIEELIEVEGIGEIRAKAIKDGFRKLREELIYDRNL
ncbi:MAG TPA: DNA integrity scanning protein DisA [Clostridia bacterium]|jgi:diadenylate cyclase|nr:DNA integrity scanning protein DisA [Clostridia bacterium]